MADPVIIDQILSALGVGGTGTGGFAIWRQFSMSREMAEFKIKVAEEYVRNESIAEIKADIRDIKALLMERK